MRYEASKAYISERQGGPWRVFMVMIILFVVALVFHWRTYQELDIVNFFWIGSFILIVALIGFRVSQRMAKTTKLYEQYTVFISSEGIDVQSNDWQFSVPAKEFRELIIFRSLFSPRLSFFQLKHSGGHFFTLPLESSEYFAEEFISLFPNVPVVRRVKFLLNFE